jgi:hypothetical protein
MRMEIPRIEAFSMSRGCLLVHLSVSLVLQDGGGHATRHRDTVSDAYPALYLQSMHLNVFSVRTGKEQQEMIIGMIHFYRSEIPVHQDASHVERENIQTSQLLH